MEGRGVTTDLLRSKQCTLDGRRQNIHVPLATHEIAKKIGLSLARETRAKRVLASNVRGKVWVRVRSLYNELLTGK